LQLTVKKKGKKFRERFYENRKKRNQSGLCEFCGLTALLTRNDAIEALKSDRMNGIHRMENRPDLKDKGFTAWWWLVDRQSIL